MMLDREKVIKGLQEIVDDKWMKVHADWYVSVCSDALVLLKEQEAVVRCKECKHWYFADNRRPSERENVCGRNGVVVTPDWYCADGERVKQ
jgi:hypothetical protein